MSFAGALSGRQPAPSIDPVRASEQHALYVKCLRSGGYEVVVLAAEERYPDAPFVEDTAVLMGDLLVVARPGAVSRRGEEEGVERALAQSFRVARVGGPGTLEGGDVLQRGRVLYVGRSGRTSDDAIAQLAELAAGEGRTVVPVPVRGALHLKSVVTPVDGGTLVAAPGHFDPSVFSGQRILWAEEGGEVNVLALPDGTVLVPASKESVVRLLERSGFDVVTVDVSEFEKADGGLTCLSLRTDDG